MKIKLFILIAVALVAFGGVQSVGARDNDDSSSSTTEDRTEDRSDRKLKVKLGDNLEKNKEIRNITQEKKEEVKKIERETREKIKDLKEDRKNSTTTRESKEEFKGVRKTLEKRMKRDVFETRKNALVRQLTVSFNIMTEARTRISDFIVKRDTSTTTATTTVYIMAPAKAALVIADQKLAQAKISLDALAAFHYASTTASTTAEIDLEKPRKVGDDAIKALKDARDALKDVVKAINKALHPERKDDTKND